MPLNPANCRVFHRTLFAQEMQKIVLLKRGPDQQQGTVTSHIMFDCRRSRITSTGEPIDGDQQSDTRTIWHIPRTEMNRVGVQYFSPGDRIVDYKNRYWEPESPQIIDIKLFENHVDIQCVRINPPYGGPASPAPNG